MKMKFHRFSWIVEEIGFLTLLAIPPSIMSFTEGLQMKLSNVFIGRASGENVSAMLSALYIAQVVTTCTSYTISEGLSICVSILTSQAYGAKQYKLIGLYYYRVLLLAVLICFPLFALLISLGPIVYHFTEDWELSLNAGGYASILCFGFPAYAFNKISIRFLQAQNIVWGPMIYLIIGNIINGLLQYIFIFHCNFGIPGAAASFVISVYCITIPLFAHIRFSDVHNLMAVELNIDLINGWSHTARYIIPPILQTSIGTVSNNVFPVIILLMISHNNSQLAMYSIMYSVWFAFSLFTMGYTSAITVRVGHLLGAKDTKMAKRSAIFGIILGEAILIICCTGLILLSNPLSNLFTTDINFANELHSNLIILSFIIVSDIMLFGQGIMNASGMQDMQALIKFIFKVVLGFIAEYLLVKMVTWKAVCIFCIQSCASVLCFTFTMAFIFSRNWDSFTIKINQDIQSTSSLAVTKYSNIEHTRELKYICKSKVYLVFRYTCCLVFGIFMFIAAYLYNI